MWTRIGLALARQQLRANGGAVLTKSVAVRGPAVAHSGVILRRSFVVSRYRPYAAAAAAAKPKKRTRTTTAKPKTKKSAAKPKAKKAAVKKPKKTAVKKTVRPKKVLTEEEKRKLLIRKLKKVAKLHEEPAKLPVGGPWQVFLAARFKGQQRLSITEEITEVSNQYKNLSASELEKYKATFTANKLENEATLKAWILEHTPQEIVEINNARRHLNRLKAFTRKVPLLNDPRSPKKPKSAYFLYVMSRVQSGYKLLPSTAKQLGEEWRALSDSERQPFLDNYHVDLVRYKQEIKSVYNRELHQRATSDKA